MKFSEIPQEAQTIAMLTLKGILVSLQGENEIVDSSKNIAENVKAAFVSLYDDQPKVVTMVVSFSQMPYPSECAGCCHCAQSRKEMGQ